MYGHQWPEASRANPTTQRHHPPPGRRRSPAPHRLSPRRHNGDPNFNPSYPFNVRGSVDPLGNILAGANVSNLTYAIDIPVVTNAVFDILVRSDASSANTLVKLDGGLDLNSQMGLGPTSGGVGRTGPICATTNRATARMSFRVTNRRPCNSATARRNSPPRNAANNTIVSLGAETYYLHGRRFDARSSRVQDWRRHHEPDRQLGLARPDECGDLAEHQPADAAIPLESGGRQPVDVWVKVGFQFQINTCFIYYTTDGSNPEGAFGIGKGTTQVVQALYVDHDSATNNIDWWKGTIPAQTNGTQVRYKVALFNGGSIYAGQSIQPISDAEPSGSKLYGLTQAAITNFNPTTAVVWLHNDLNTNNTTIGLQAGFHIVRARTFLPRSKQVQRLQHLRPDVLLRCRLADGRDCLAGDKWHQCHECQLHGGRAR